MLMKRCDDKLLKPTFGEQSVWTPLEVSGNSLKVKHFSCCQKFVNVYLAIIYTGIRHPITDNDTNIIIPW